MAAKFTPRLVELTYEAALKSFWRKEALKKFLRASYISENFLATWGGEESKRDFLDKVFQKLHASDKDKAVIFALCSATAFLASAIFCGESSGHLMCAATGPTGTLGTLGRRLDDPSWPYLVDQPPRRGHIPTLSCRLE